MGFFGRYQLSPVTLADGTLARVLLDAKGRVQVSVTGLVANYTTVGYESLTVSSSAVGLASIPTTAVRAFITVEDANVRFRVDGTVPTTIEGHALAASDILLIESASDIAAFRAIRDDAVDAILKVTYQL